MLILILLHKMLALTLCWPEVKFKLVALVLKSLHALLQPSPRLPHSTPVMLEYFPSIICPLILHFLCYDYILILRHHQPLLLIGHLPLPQKQLKHPPPPYKPSAKSPLELITTILVQLL